MHTERETLPQWYEFNSGRKLHDINALMLSCVRDLQNTHIKHFYVYVINIEMFSRKTGKPVAAPRMLRMWWRLSQWAVGNAEKENRTGQKERSKKSHVTCNRRTGHKVYGSLVAKSDLDIIIWRQIMYISVLLKWNRPKISFRAVMCVTFLYAKSVRFQSRLEHQVSWLKVSAYLLSSINMLG
jgi:hypothetical protein